MKRLRRLLRCIFILPLILFFASQIYAQKDTGSIVGVVKDAGGGVVPGAKVTARDVDRGVEFTTTTDSNGEYVAGPLKVGRYTVTVEKDKFKTAVAGPVLFLSSLTASSWLVIITVVGWCILRAAPLDHLMSSHL